MLVRVLDEELYSEELEKGVFTPRYSGDAGVDLRSRIHTRVHSGETARIPLGLAISVPPDTVGWVSGRSSTALEFGLFTHEGKIDSGYRGEIHTFVTAQGSPVDIARGERIAQIVVVRILRPEWTIIDEFMDNTERGLAGLGSSGRS